METDNKPQEKKSKSKKDWWLKWYVFVSAFIIIAALWIFSYFVIMNVSSGCQELAGQTGDTFGAINALFSGFAFTGIIFTILIQSKELRLQRTELRLTRRELKLTRAQYEEQNKNLKKQSFETTFFNLLNSNRTMVVNNLQYGSSHFGHNAMTIFMNDFRQRAQTLFRGSRDDFQSSNQAYNELITSTNETFYRFIFSIDTLISYVNENEVGVEHSEFYLSVIASTFSQGAKEFIQIFLKYDKFMNQPRNDLRTVTQLIRY